MGSSESCRSIERVRCQTSKDDWRRNLQQNSNPQLPCVEIALRDSPNRSCVNEKHGNQNQNRCLPFTGEADHPRPKQVELFLRRQRPSEKENDSIRAMEVFGVDPVVRVGQKSGEVPKELLPSRRVRLEPPNQQHVERKHRVIEWENPQRPSSIEVGERDSAVLPKL